jgi:hypothetical protein
MWLACDRGFIGGGVGLDLRPVVNAPGLTEEEPLLQTSSSGSGLRMKIESSTQPKQKKEFY